MSKQIIVGVASALLLISTFILAFDIQLVESEAQTIVVPDDYSTIQAATPSPEPTQTPEATPTSSPSPPPSPTPTETPTETTSPSPKPSTGISLPIPLFYGGVVAFIALIAIIAALIIKTKRQ